jgi:LPS export ABC transporter permease LptG
MARVRLFLLPQILDTYILSSFLFYFGLLLVSFVLIFQVFTFFELLNDILKNQVPMAKVLTYMAFLTPKLLYDFTPISVLAAVLAVFGVLAKHNEVTAFKASGVSVYRLGVPILLSGGILSGALFAFDHYYVPEANRRQDALRAEIKGKPPQTYFSPDRRWIYGRQGQDRIYYCRYFDQWAGVMYGVSVYEIDPGSFTLKRHIAAEKARWETSLKTWVFQNGWWRALDGARPTEFHDFSGSTSTFPELDEPPDWFVKEVWQGKQMNFRELDDYIRELQQSGLDTVPLQVQFHRKFSVPLFALIMAMVSLPFGFVAGNRGAMAGVGLSFAIAIAYWSLSQLFEKVGNVSQLPAPLAAWSPDMIFALAGLYFLTRMRT